MSAAHSLTEEQVKGLRQYVRQTWGDLTRSLAHALSGLLDSKVMHRPGYRWPLYISAKEDPERVTRLLNEVADPEELCRIEIMTLPADVQAIREHGLLFLPGEYVVPGGRFNELYGWDSYFILLGLLHDNQDALALSLVGQLIYEIEHYGMVLNANRTYYLTRSHPPLLTAMVLKMFERTQDRDWLRACVPALESYYHFWTTPPHLIQGFGLSRYLDLGEGPAPEVLASEFDELGRSHFDRVREFYRQNKVDDYDVSLFYDQKGDRLTDLFYLGDRAMRESGFDPTNRFGPFSVDIVHYAPVCLNTLLYQMEHDLGWIHGQFGHPRSAAHWEECAVQRQKLIHRLLWDEESGLFLDYHFQKGQRRRYDFLTTFYPLWMGLASAEQAARVVEHLPDFETPGGLRTSRCMSGCQWDSPFGWAPLHWITVQGLLRYGYNEDAKRIAAKFVTLVGNEFSRSGAIYEKYDVEQCSSDVSPEIKFGYTTNEPGFGWTNGVVLDFLETVLK